MSLCKQIQCILPNILHYHTYIVYIHVQYKYDSTLLSTYVLFKYIPVKPTREGLLLCYLAMCKCAIYLLNVSVDSLAFYHSR